MRAWFRGGIRLAHKIQEALVPAAPRLDRCDVAVTMKPAEDVGGDYYDVIRAGGREWILIGDASGHGVPAGPAKGRRSRTFPRCRSRLKDDIAGAMDSRSFALGSGDVLVVYTDGITEASRSGEIFDTSGLRRVLAASRGRTARQILDETFAALDDFQISDDATMLVVRQL